MFSKTPWKNENCYSALDRDRSSDIEQRGIDGFVHRQSRVNIIVNNALRTSRNDTIEDTLADKINSMITHQACCYAATQRRLTAALNVSVNRRTGINTGAGLNLICQVACMAHAFRN